MERGKAYGPALAPVWQMAVSVRRRQSFHAGGGLHGVSLVQFPPGAVFRAPDKGVLPKEAEAFVAAVPDYVLYSGQVPLAWHSPLSKRWHVAKPLKQVHPVLRKHQVMARALVDLAAVVGCVEDPDAPGHLRGSGDGGG